MYAVVREQQARQRLSVEVLLEPRCGPLLIVTLDMHFFLNAVYESSVFFFCDIISRQLTSSIVLSHCMFSSRARLSCIHVAKHEPTSKLHVLRFRKYK